MNNDAELGALLRRLMHEGGKAVSWEFYENMDGTFKVIARVRTSCGHSYGNFATIEDAIKATLGYPHEYGWRGSADRAREKLGIDR